MATVEVRSVSKSFSHRRRDTTVVLDDISISIAQGDFVSLVGKSGCGKSTLLRIIGGFLSHDDGEVLVDGRRVEGPGSDRGMLFQRPMLFPWLTVLDNTLFGPKSQGLSARESTERAVAMLQTVGLAKFMSHYPSQLSGGMMHRAAFARALMANPKILLLDEPFGALDSFTRASMQNFLLDLWENQNLTVLLVTHDVEEAVLLSDSIAVMSASPGRITEQITVDLERPRDYDMTEQPEFVALKKRVRHAVDADVPTPA